MSFLQALILGIVQGLTEFLPVSSSGHLMIFKELLGVDTEHFWDFTMTVHLATVLSTIIVFSVEIKKLIVGFFQWKYNKETDYILKLAVSAVPVAIVGLCFKSKLDSIFDGSLMFVGIFLVCTAILLFISDQVLFYRGRRSQVVPKNEAKNGISYLQAIIVGIAQAFAVLPGLSRSGSTIAVGLISGVRKEVIAQFSFLMVLAPIIAEQCMDIAKLHSSNLAYYNGLSWGVLLVAFVSAFLSGLFACKFMVNIVRKAKLTWFALYCLVAALLIFIF